jgi:hypothetical protein
VSPDGSILVSAVCHDPAVGVSCRATCTVTSTFDGCADGNVLCVTSASCGGVSVTQKTVRLIRPHQWPPHQSSLLMVSELRQ